VNKANAARARVSGAMSGSGERLIIVAQQTGMWLFRDDVERLERPEYLDSAL